MMTPPRSARCEKLQQKSNSRDSSRYLGIVGGKEGMREARVHWTEFTWCFDTFDYICLSDFLFGHIVTNPLPPQETEGSLGNSPPQKLSLLLKRKRNSISN